MASFFDHTPHTDQLILIKSAFNFVFFVGFVAQATGQAIIAFVEREHESAVTLDKRDRAIGGGLITGTIKLAFARLKSCPSGRLQASDMSRIAIRRYRQGGPLEPGTVH